MPFCLFCLSHSGWEDAVRSCLQNSPPSPCHLRSGTAHLCKRGGHHNAPEATRGHGTTGGPTGHWHEALCDAKQPCHFPRSLSTRVRAAPSHLPTILKIQRRTVVPGHNPPATLRATSTEGRVGLLDGASLTPRVALLGTSVHGRPAIASHSPDISAATIGRGQFACSLNRFQVGAFSEQLHG